MKFLITGGAGFIGSHLSEKILKHGDQVCIIDNLSTGRMQNIIHLLKNPGFRFVQASILDRKVVDTLVEDCDVIFHLAAVVGVELILQDPINMFETNVIGTEIILKAADRFGKKVVIASSSEVYGKNINSPFKESGDLCLGPTNANRWVYANAKALDEHLAFAYYYKRNLPIVIVRFFNVIGSRQVGSYGMVVPRFVRGALIGENLTVFGDGTQTRCFIDVTDACHAIYQLSQNTSAVGEVFNVGSDREISIMDLANLVIRITSSPSKIEIVPYASLGLPGFEDVCRRVPDTTKISNLINFKPQFSLEAALQRIVDYWSKSA